MINLGLGANNLVSRAEDLKKSPSQPFSISSDRTKENTLTNSSSTKQNKTLEKKSEFSEKFEKANKNQESSSGKSESKASNKEEAAQTYKSYSSKESSKFKKSQSTDGQVDVKEEDAEKVGAHAKDYTQIVPIYSQNQFFAPQAPVPVNANPIGETTEDKTLRLLDTQNVSVGNQPIVKFMKELYQKFGIPPEKLVAAFQSLPTESLLQSPGMAMEALFQKLEMQPGDYTKAQVLFNEMIDGVNKQAQNAEYKQVQTKPTLIDQFKLQNQNTDALAGMTIATSPLAEAQPMGAAPEMAPQVSTVMPKNTKTTLEQMLQERILQGNLNTSSIPQANFAAPTEIGLNASNAEPIFDAGFLKGLAEELEAAELETNLESVDSSAEADSKLADILKSLGDKSSGKEDSEKRDDLSKFLSLQDLKGKDAKMDAVPKMVIEVNTKENKLNSENIEKIMSQAQTIAQKGGGEMKIQLRPDGLGEINLRIQVVDGKVGLQMVTESQDAKKLLEGSLHELKSALTEHKLNLQDIKVDVSQKTQQDMLQQDFKREDAREFLGQFRQFNEGFRQGFSDSSGMVRQYRSASQPSGNSGISPTEVQEKRNNNGRLHLVA